MKYKTYQNWLSLTVDEKFDGSSIEELFRYFHLSKKNIHLLKQNKEYKLNQHFVPASTILKKNDTLMIKAFSKDTSPFIPQYYPLDIIYEDDLILIINKKPGMNVHPDKPNGTDTLCNYVQYYYNAQNYSFPVRYIHRLDFDTSGLILFCKCQFIQSYLDYELSIKNIKRNYLAIVEGIIKAKGKQTIKNYIAKDRHSSNKMRVSKSGQLAITHYQKIKTSSNLTLVKCSLETGRTHQIRVHLSSIGHPILGDLLYGKPSDKIHRQALHAYELELVHPITQEVLSLTCEIPEDMKNII